MNGQKGMTMVELVVAIAITGIIVVFLGTAIYQIITVSEYGNDRLTAMHELQNAAHRFSLDAQKAVSASVDGELLLTISETSSITYALVGTELRRTEDDSQTTLARNISSAEFSIDSRLITMSLTSSPEGRNNVSENGTYKVFLRPSEGE
jgi:prepilin-type N-terminal cleavage/methylation domain-containing protein